MNYSQSANPNATNSELDAKIITKHDPASPLYGGDWESWLGWHLPKTDEDSQSYGGTSN